MDYKSLLNFMNKKFMVGNSLLSRAINYESRIQELQNIEYYLCSAVENNDPKNLHLYLKTFKFAIAEDIADDAMRDYIALKLCEEQMPTLRAALPKAKFTLEWPPTTPILTLCLKLIQKSNTLDIPLYISYCQPTLIPIYQEDPRQSIDYQSSEVHTIVSQNMVRVIWGNENMAHCEAVICEHQNKLAALPFYAEYGRSFFRQYPKSLIYMALGTHNDVPVIITSALSLAVENNLANEKEFDNPLPNFVSWFGQEPETFDLLANRNVYVLVTEHSGVSLQDHFEIARRLLSKISADCLRGVLCNIASINTLDNIHLVTTPFTLYSKHAFSNFVDGVTHQKTQPSPPPDSPRLGTSYTSSCINIFHDKSKQENSYLSYLSWGLGLSQGFDIIRGCACERQDVLYIEPASFGAIKKKVFSCDLSTYQLPRLHLSTVEPFRHRNTVSPTELTRGKFMLAAVQTSFDDETSAARAILDTIENAVHLPNIIIVNIPNINKLLGSRPNSSLRQMFDRLLHLQITPIIVSSNLSPAIKAIATTIISSSQHKGRNGGRFIISSDAGCSQVINYKPTIYGSQLYLAKSKYSHCEGLIRQRTQDGLCEEDIAASLGLSIHTLRQLKRRWNIKVNRTTRNRRKNISEKIYRLADQGWSNEDIAHKLNIARYYVEKRLNLRLLSQE